MCSVQTWPQCGRKSPDFGVHVSCRNRGQCSGQSTFCDGACGIGRDCEEGGVGPRACVAEQLHSGVLITSLAEGESFLP